MKNNNNNEMVVVNTYEMHIYSFTTPEKAQKELEKAKAYYEKCAKECEENAKGPHNKDGFFIKQAENYKNATLEIMTYAQFEQLQKNKLLNRPLTQTTKENFWKMLEVLPPIGWMTINNIEVFCMSEFYTSSFTTQYAYDKINDKYYCKLVDYSDKNTWIPYILQNEIDKGNVIKEKAIFKSEIKQIIEEMSDSEILNLYNEYCYNNNDYYNSIYSMDDLNSELEGRTPTDIINIVRCGDFNPNHKYFKYNGYGNLISTDYIIDWLEVSDIVNFIMLENNALYNTDIQNILDEMEESTENE